MAQISLEVFLEKLKRFTKVTNKEKIAKKLSELTQDPDYEILPILLDEISSRSPELITTENMKLIIAVLENIEVNKADAVFEIFAVDSLNKINTIPSKTIKKILILLPYFAKNSEIPLNEIIFNTPFELIEKYSSILSRLSHFKIKTDSLEIWDPILDVDDSWFLTDLYIKDKLHPHLFTPFGLQYVFKHFKLADLDAEKITAINKLIDWFIKDETDEMAWQQLEKGFFSEKKMEIGMERITKIITAIQQEAIEIKKLQLLVEFLLSNPNLLKEENFTHIIDVLLKLSPRFYSLDGMTIFNRILKLGYVMTNEYIQAINTLITMPQLGLLKVLENLSDEWLTEIGLTKLIKFSAKFLTPEGLKFISTLNPASITETIIEDLNQTNLDVLVRQVGSSNGLNEADILSNVDRIKKIQNLIVSMKKSSGAVIKDKVEKQKENLVDFFLNEECSISLQKIFSRKESDALIYIPPTRNVLLTESELNNELCLVSTASGYIIHSRAECEEMAEKQQLYMGKKFTQDMILSFSKENFDIDLLNTNIFNNEVDSARISFFEQLLTSPLLASIPAPLFANDAALLTLLDLGYLKNDVLFALLKRCITKNVNEFEIKELNSIIPGLLKITTFISLDSISMLSQTFFEGNIKLFSMLDPIYVTNEKFIIFLNKIAANGFTKEKIDLLNEQAKDLSPILNALTTEQLNQIPPALFSDAKLLNSLDKRYLSNQFMFEYLKIVIKDSITEQEMADLNNVADKFEELSKKITVTQLQEVPKQFFDEGKHFLADINDKFLLNNGMLLYLKKTLKNINVKDIEMLNSIADTLFNKFNKHANITAILEKLPKRFFNIEQFSPEIFARIPENWLKHSVVQQILQECEEIITPDCFKEGLAMLAFTDISHAIEKLKLSEDEIYLIYTSEELVSIFNVYKEHELFPDLLKSGMKFIEKLLPLLQKPEYAELRKCLYRYASINKDLFSPNLYKELRTLVKQDLLPASKFEDFEIFKEQVNSIADVLKKGLDAYESSKLTVNGNEVKKSFFKSITTTQAHVQAYLMLRKASSNSETAFADLLACSCRKDLQAKAGFSDSFSLTDKSLFKITSEFLAAARSYYNNQDNGFVPIIRACLEEGVEDKLRIALLDDLFYSLLFVQQNFIETEKPVVPDNLLLIAKTRSEVFFDIMTVYRPKELLELADCDNSEEIRNIYIKYKENKKKEKGNVEVETLEKPKEVAVVESQNNKTRNSTRLPIPNFNYHSPESEQKVEQSNGTTTIPQIENKKSTNFMAALNSNFYSNMLKSKKNGNSLFGNRIKRPAGNLFRIEKDVKEYQLIDVDIYVGYSILQEYHKQKLSAVAKEQDTVAKNEADVNGIPVNSEKENNPDNGIKENGQVNKNSSDNEEIVFLPVGLLKTQSQEQYADNSVLGLEKITSKHKGKICFGALNINGVHYVTIFLYTSPEGKTQLIFLDSAYETHEKKFNVEKVKIKLQTLFPAWNITDYSFIQQFNDADCGIDVLENGRALINHNLVTVENNQMVFHRERLTLDGMRFRELNPNIPDRELSEKFDQSISVVRAHWETELSKPNEVFSLDQEGAQVLFGPYSFNNNKTLSRLKVEGQNLLSQIVGTFSDVKEDDILLILTESEIAKFKDAVESLIQNFIEKSDDCAQFYKIAEVMKDIDSKTQGEVLSFKKETLDQKMFDIIVGSIREQKRECFNEQFFDFLLKKEAINSSTSSLPSEQFIQHYNEFYASSDDREWFQYFESRGSYSHQEKVKAYVDGKIKNKKIYSGSSFSLLKKFGEDFNQTQNNGHLNNAKSAYVPQAYSQLFSEQKKPAVKSSIEKPVIEKTLSAEKATQETVSPLTIAKTIHSSSNSNLAKNKEAMQETSTTNNGLIETKTVLTVESSNGNSHIQTLNDKKENAPKPQIENFSPRVSLSIPTQANSSPRVSLGIKQNSPEDIEKVKQFVSNILQNLLTDLAKYPLKPQRSVFGVSHTDQKIVENLKINCQKWSDLLTDTDSIEKVRMIQGQIMQELNNIVVQSLEPNVFGKYSLDDLSHGNLIKRHLADLVGVSSKEFNDYNKPDLITQKIQLRGEKQATTQQISGYACLLHSIAKKFAEFKRKHQLPDIIDDLTLENSMSNGSKNLSH